MKQSPISNIVRNAVSLKKKHLGKLITFSDVTSLRTIQGLILSLNLCISLKRHAILTQQKNVFIEDTLH